MKYELFVSCLKPAYNAALRILQIVTKSLNFNSSPVTRTTLVVAEWLCRASRRFAFPRKIGFVHCLFIIREKPPLCSEFQGVGYSVRNPRSGIL